MRLAVLGIALCLLVAPARLQAACHPTELGLYRDPLGFDCSIEWPLAFTELTVLVCAFVEGRPPIDEVSFRIDDWLDTLDGPFLISTTWYADQVEGELGEGVTLRWNTPVRPEGASERLLVGEIRVFCYGVPSAPHTVTIRDRHLAGPDYASDFDSVWDTGEQFFTFGDAGSGGGDCTGGFWDPPAGWNAWRYVDPPDGSSVSGDFTLRADIEAWGCEYQFAEAIVGRVLLGDAVLAAFNGAGLVELAVEIPTAGLPTGEEFTVRVDLDLGGADHLLHYRLESTPAERRSLSAVKALYR